MEGVTVLIFMLLSGAWICIILGTVIDRMLISDVNSRLDRLEKKLEEFKNKL